MGSGYVPGGCGDLAWSPWASVSLSWRSGPGPPVLMAHPPSHPYPLAKRCRLQPRDAAKMPESAWKFLFYLGAWSYSTYLLFGTDYPFFHDPPSVFYGRAPPRVGQVGGGLYSGHGHS